MFTKLNIAKPILFTVRAESGCFVNTEAIWAILRLGRSMVHLAASDRSSCSNDQVYTAIVHPFSSFQTWEPNKCLLKNYHSGELTCCTWCYSAISGTTISRQVCGVLTKDRLKVWIVWSICYMLTSTCLGELGFFQQEMPSVFLFCMPMPSCWSVDAKTLSGSDATRIGLQDWAAMCWHGVRHWEI